MTLLCDAVCELKNRQLLAIRINPSKGTQLISYIVAACSISWRQITEKKYMAPEKINNPLQTNDTLIRSHTASGKMSPLTTNVITYPILLYKHFRI